MDNDYSDFIHHDYDGDGMPFSYAVNPIHTVFAIQGSPEAIKKAVNIVTRAWIGNPRSAPIYDCVSLGHCHCGYLIDIEANDTIPQLYDAIRDIEGIEAHYYATYDAAHRQMFTDNLDLAQYLRRSRKLKVDIEVDDEPDMFPDDNALSVGGAE